MEWQPIETAPRNGVSVLAWCVQFEEVLVASWENYAWRCGDEMVAPSHWMPLPGKPADLILAEQRKEEEFSAKVTKLLGALDNHQENP